MVTFNVLHGRSAVDGRVDGDRFAEAVSALDADVLGLQEVDLEQPRSGRLDLTALAARAMGAGEHRFAAALVGTPGERFRVAGVDGVALGGPSFGVALVSRLPVRSWHVLRLPAAPLRSPVLVPAGGVFPPTTPAAMAAVTSPVEPAGRRRLRLRLLRDEPRVALAAVLRTPHGSITVATTHLSFVPAWNVAQLRRVVRALRALPGPRVLLGDLNMPAAAAAAVSGWRPLARCATFPSVRPRVQLDHVLTDAPRRLRVLAAGAPPSPVSDHRPLAVEVAWDRASAGADNGRGVSLD